MNTLKFYPKKFRQIYEKNILHSGVSKTPERYHNKILTVCIMIAVIFSTAFYFLKIHMLYALLIFVVLNLFFYFRVSLKASAKIKKMEMFFPDVISLMASNLRSGMTIDRSFLLAARPEFAPLDQEILKAGKDIATGKNISYALKNMSDRIDSEKISKVIMLIVSGLKAGGNISDLLEQTASNMKEKEFIEKRAASSILMYVVFIFFAIGIGAPVLFALSSILVGIIIQISARVPDIGSAQMNVPLAFNEIGISASFVVYFAILFIILTDLISSLVIGLVNKGEAKDGLRFFIPLVCFSLGVFFVVRLILSRFLAGAFAMV